MAAGREQHLARLNATVVTLTRDLEDERDLSAAHAARNQAGPVPLALARARAATDTAARAVRAGAAGIGAGYQPGTVLALGAVLASIADLGTVRNAEHVQRHGRQRHDRRVLAGHRHYLGRAAPGRE